MRRHRSFRDERGFALPFAIFLITLITILLASAFSRASIEFEIASSSEATITTMEVARSGLRAYLSDSVTVRPVPGDSFRYNVVGGYAWVFPEVILAPADTLRDFRYIIRSTGYLIEPSQGAEPQASRTLAQFATWSQGQIRAPAAYVAINGVSHDYSDFDVDVSGIDECSARDVMGFRGPHPGTVPDGNYLGGTISGSPLNALQSDSRNTLVLNDVAALNWSLILSGGITPDHPSPIHLDNSFSTYVIYGDYDAPDGLSGTGLLIVTGRMDTGNNAFTWDGLILVGEDFDFDAEVTNIRGMLVTGLGTPVGGPYPSVNDMDEDGSPNQHALTLQYNSCSVAQSLQRFRGFSVTSNAQIDNWATY